MRIIRTGKGVEIKVSEEDFNELNSRKWTISSTGYAVANIKGKLISMHRFLTKAKKGIQVDHINREKLDNQRGNLRLVNAGVNSRNKSIQDSGITWRGGHHQSWCARFRIRVNQNIRSICLGYFKDKSDAKRAHSKYRGMCISLQLSGMNQQEVFDVLHADRCAERKLLNTRGWRVWS